MVTSTGQSSNFLKDDISLILSKSTVIENRFLKTNM